MAELTFIPFDGQDDSNKRKKKREAIRVHVMKNFHRQRKREAVQRRINHAYEARNELSSGTAGDSSSSTAANETSSQQGLPVPLNEYYNDKGLASLILPNYFFLANLQAERSLSPVFQTHEFIDQREQHPIFGGYNTLV
jgi:hypothetical protein